MRTWDYCRRCGSDNIVKRGKSISGRKGYWTQRYQCKDCGMKFTDQKKRPIVEEKFEYKSQTIPPTEWAPYNAYQINEKEMLLEIIDELLEYVVVRQGQRTGRPAKKIRDMLFCMLLKIYTRLSSRRLISDLRMAKDKGFISNVPCYSTIILYFNDKRLIKLLTALIELSALPFAEVENHFAVDSSGLSISKFGRWFDEKHGKPSEKRLFRKAHIICGVRTNVITSVIMTDQNGADSLQLKYLVKRTSLYFTMEEVSADKAYSSVLNLETIDSVGATPYIAFKSNVKKTGSGHGPIWKQSYQTSIADPQKWGEHYHKRSNVETTFNMLKQKYGDSLMTKNEVANFNEALCKILCHNISCLIHAYFKLDLKRTFWTEVPKNLKTELIY